MSDTLGSIIDKLTTTGLKLWKRQDFVYKIRKMSWEEFYKNCLEDDTFLREFYDSLQNATDLNVQRNELIKEFDETIITMINSAVKGEDLDEGKFVQRPHKTY